MTLFARVGAGRKLGSVCLCALSLAIGVFAASIARAHEFSVAVLSIEQVEADRFVTRWQRAPDAADAASAYRSLKPIFPADCRFSAPELDCAGSGLFGEIGFEGLGSRCSSAVIHVLWRGKREAQSYSFSVSQPTAHIAGGAAEDGALGRIARNFTRFGVEHILFGWDHLLFVLGLLWLVRSPLALLKTISAFTLAHSLTLTAATLGWTEVPSAPVEAVIALSIVFVAAEASKQHAGRPPGLSARMPWLVAMSFGLLHGFGFAGALSQISLAKDHLIASLLFFNLGVELGQLLFVAMVWFVRAALLHVAPAARRWAPLLHYAAGTLACFWFLQRMASS